MLETAQSEVLICTSVSDFEDKSRVLVPALERINKSNIKLKIVLSGEQDRVKRLVNRLNLKAKHTDSMARFYISDKKEMIFMTTPENADEEMGVWLNSQFFTESLVSIIDNALKSASK
jgi:sugar-specific transcriptional regulator TrmB